jgi:hypothetical protein
MLDINVGNEDSYGLATEITDRGVPFLFASGYGDSVPTGAGRVTAPVVVKPYERNQLCAAVGKAVTAPRGADAIATASAPP